MRVRCGRCQTEFDAVEPGRHACPACGAVNEVRTRAEPTQPVAAAMPEPPSPRAECGSCGFSFIVGDVAEAPCPNCGTGVTVGRSEGVE